MIRLDLRYIGAATFLAAIALASASCGGNSTSGPGTNPSGVIPTPTPSNAPTATPTGPTPTPSPVNATISYSGDIQNSFFVIVLSVTGAATVTGPSTITPMPGNVPLTVTSQFFTDLNLSGGVKNLKIGTCPTPTGTVYNNTTVISYQGQISGNVACPAPGSRTVQVYNDVKAVEQALGITPPAPLD